MEKTIQIRSRGVMTLPADLREKYGIQAGDSFRVVDLDGIFVLTPMVPMVPELAREIEKARREAGLSVEELLEGLREQREQYHKETYEPDAP
jgi:bifunctional DNA-binding transcriptional regulator/antitoxin component of YhaV-PrlF toxin-antitoxin module